MLKEQVKHKKLISGTSNIETLVNLHRSIFIDTPLENNLIYFDSNFKNYLTNLSETRDNFIYVVEIDNSIEGFVHLRHINDCIFLNNIAINPEFKGKGLGKNLLTFAAKEILKQFMSNSIFRLDVFESNKDASSWYYRLGFKVVSQIEWFKFVHSFKSVSSKINNIEKLDQNGFLSVFYEGDKIGTVIQNNLIIHDIKKIDGIYLSKYENILINDSGIRHLPNSSELIKSLNIIDVSLRMENTLINLLKNLES